MANSIYRVPNEIAPDRAAQGDHYDMKINAIIKALEGATAGSTGGPSTPITDTVTETPFDRTVTVPAGTLRNGKTWRIRALIQTTKAVAGHTFTLKAKYTPAGGAAVTFLTQAAIDPVDGVATNAYILEAELLVVGTNSNFLNSLGGKLTDVTGGTNTMIAPTGSELNMALDSTKNNVVSITVTWSNADAGNSIELHALTSTVS